MNEENSSVVLPDQGDVLAAEDLTPAVDPVADTVEIVAEVVQDRPFLTTDFEEYSVSEGLLLMLLLALFVMAIVKIVKGGFYWL